jgi:hypothetical protein
VAHDAVWGGGADGHGWALDKYAFGQHVPWPGARPPTRQWIPDPGHDLLETNAVGVLGRGVPGDRPAATVGGQVKLGGQPATESPQRLPCTDDSHHHRPDRRTRRLGHPGGLARQAGHDEIHAWVYETQAWSALTDGDYRRSLDLSRTAQQIAPRGSSPAIQATA